MDPNQANIFAFLKAFQTFQQNQSPNSQNPQLPNPNINFQVPQFSSQNSDTPPSTYPTQFGGSDSASNPTPRTTPVQINSEFQSGCLEGINLNDDIDNRVPRNSKHWIWEEDNLIISAWLNISKDAIVGTDQKGETFWERIHQYCVDYKVGSKWDRKRDAIKKRWHRINLYCQKFGAAYDQATRTARSGTNEDDIMNRAHQIYFVNESSKFTFFEHWLILRREQKWKSQPTESGGSSKWSKINYSGAYTSSSNREIPAEGVPEVESPKRPQGNKAAKRNAKGKSKANETEELKFQAQIKMGESKMAESEARMWETYRDLVLADTSKLSPLQQEAHQKAVQKLLEKLG